MNHRLARMLTAASGIFLAAALGAAPASAHPPTRDPAPDRAPTVIAEGLNNPRHLAFGPGGALFVAESGTGGEGPCIPSAEFDGSVCYGPTGSITSISYDGHRSRSHKGDRGHHGHGSWSQFRVVTGLPSLAGADGSSATGPSDVAFSGRNYVATIGLGADPAVRAAGAATSPDGTPGQTLPRGFGYLIEGSMTPAKACASKNGAHVCRAKNWTPLADISGFEAKNNPVDDADSNPASVERIRNGWVVSDAGGNTVLSVNQRGSASLVAAFEDVMVEFPPGTGQEMPMQFVPTSAVAGPHGSYFVSQLTGFPFPQNGAAIWKVTPGHGKTAATVTAYATGLTNVTDVAVAKNGDLYAVQISTTGLASPQGPTNGSLVRISHERGHKVTTIAGGLFAPYGVALDGGFAYVTTGSVVPGGGQVIQVPLGR